MAAPPANNELGLKETFYRSFQQDVAALQAQMENLSEMSTSTGERNNAMDNCLADIDRLSHDIKDASGYLPAYDQRTYSETIKSLSEKLQTIRNSFNPPKKFSFKARKNANTIPKNAPITPSVLSSDAPNTNAATATIMPSPRDHSTQTEETSQEDSGSSSVAEEDLKIIGASTGIRRPSFSKSTQIFITKYADLHIILPTAASHATSSGTMSNLTRCVVDASSPTANGAPFAALYLKNIKDSLIVCGQVAGAVHITDVENSVIVVACRQFRMHGSKNVDVYLHAASRPIFEDCKGLRFAPLPETYMTPAISQIPNQWDQIDDFKWLKAEPSPHFKLLLESQRVDEGFWRDQVCGEQSLTLDDILKAAGVR